MVSRLCFNRISATAGEVKERNGHIDRKKDHLFMRFCDISNKEL